MKHYKKSLLLGLNTAISCSEETIYRAGRRAAGPTPRSQPLSGTAPGLAFR